MTSLPQLPELNGELTLAVFTHKSVTQPVATDRVDESLPYGSVDRLCFVGKNVFISALSTALYNKLPMLSYQALEEQLDALKSFANITKWVNEYRFKEKVICTPDARPQLSEEQETLALFYAYIGAIFHQHGQVGVQRWIGGLVSPGASMPASPRAGGSSYVPIPSSSSFGVPAGAGPLAMFNQTAMQRHKDVRWNAESTGPAHMLTWRIQCVVDGEIKGEGIDTNKKAAKEEAARKAMTALGW